MAINKSMFETLVTKENMAQINTKGGIVTSHPNGGCGLQGCRCSPGHWISILKPLEDGKVKGALFTFDTRAELEAFARKDPESLEVA